jgi:hypothetical protein
MKSRICAALTPLRRWIPAAEATGAEQPLALRRIPRDDIQFVQRNGW